MTIATLPTIETITTEGMKKAGLRDITAERLTRAKDEWLQELLNDIWMRGQITGNTRLKTLQATSVAIGVDNQRQYDLPTDFEEELVITLMDGDNTGTAQTGTLTSVTLQSGEDISQADAEGRYIVMTSGTSKGQFRPIIGYNTTSLVATIDRSWDSGKTPASGDGYLIVDTYKELDEIGIRELDESANPTSPGVPANFAKYGDQFFFDKPLDKATYGMRLRYYANIHHIDMVEGSGTLITKILTNWQGVLKTGIHMKALDSIKSTDVSRVTKIYEQMVANLIMKEIPFGGELQQLIVG